MNRSDHRLNLQLLYYAGAEDGFSGGYVTPYRIDLEHAASASAGQRALSSNDGTGFTLSSVHYNRLDAMVYGLVTFQTGGHAIAKVTQPPSSAHWRLLVGR